MSFLPSKNATESGEFYFMIQRPIRNGVFYMVQNGTCTDAGISDEMLSNEDKITAQLQDLGVLPTFEARMMTPEELEQD